MNIYYTVYVCSIANVFVINGINFKKRHNMAYSFIFQQRAGIIMVTCLLLASHFLTVSTGDQH